MEREKKKTVFAIITVIIFNLGCLVAHYEMLRLRDRKTKALQKIVEGKEQKINEEGIKRSKNKSCRRQE